MEPLARLERACMLIERYARECGEAGALTRHQVGEACAALESLRTVEDDAEARQRMLKAIMPAVGALNAMTVIFREITEAAKRGGL